MKQRTQGRKTADSRRKPDGRSGRSRGATRRDFMKVAAGTGVAMAVVPSSRALAGPLERSGRPPQGWKWVEDGELFDPDFDYAYVFLNNSSGEYAWVLEGEYYDPNFHYLNEDGSPIKWVPIDEDEPIEIGYEYVTEYEYEDGTTVVWEPVGPDEPYDPDYEYLHADGTPIAWEEVSDEDTFDPNYEYVREYEFVNEDGTPSEWEWADPNEPFDPNYKYVFAEVDVDFQG